MINAALPDSRHRLGWLAEPYGRLRRLVQPWCRLCWPGLLALILVSASVVPPRPAAGQVTAEDSAAVLLDAAEQFEARGEDDVAAALYELIVERFPNTAVAEAAASRLSGVEDRQSSGSGATEIKVWSSIYGVFLGIAVPLAFDAQGSEAYGAGLLVGGPTGFLAGRAAANARHFSIGQARALTLAGSWGTWQGAGWASASDAGRQGLGAAMIGGGAAGILVGAVVSRRETSEGTAESATLGGLWGTWFGLATAILADVEVSGTSGWAIVLNGGNLGLLGGALAGSRLQWSRSRARLISVGGLIGVTAGWGITLIAQPESERAAIAFPLAGSILGLAAGAALTRDDPLSASGEPGSAGSGAGALFNWADGALSVSLPVPSPTLSEVVRDGEPTGWTWRVPVFRVRF